MKRSTKIFLVFALILAITGWALTVADFTTVLIPYVLAALFVAGHAAYTILISIFSLKNHPE
jgi:hypothetical protein